MLIFSWLSFFTDTATTDIYTLSLHDALPICILHGEAVDDGRQHPHVVAGGAIHALRACGHAAEDVASANDDTDLHAEALRSEEHTSELQSLAYLVCRLLLEKKK